METKWPEGPYYVTSDGLTICSKATDTDLADVWHSGTATVSTTREQAIALAHLFAASPDLYAALEALEQAFTAYTQWNGDPIAEIVNARATLSHARGETK